MTEEWRKIEGWPYHVSNLGRVRRRHRLLKPGFTMGYLYVVFSYEKKRKTYRVHKLVAQAFLRSPEVFEEVHHIDGDKLNNRADNLQWLTYKEHGRLHWST